MENAFSTRIAAVAFCAVALAATATGADSAAEDWLIEQPLPAAVRLQNRSAESEQDKTFIRFQCVSSADFQEVRLVHEHPPALAMDEFRASVAVNSAQKGIRLALRMVLPNQTDPRTGEPLETWVIGEESSATNEWQTLTIAGDKATVQARVRQLRAELSQPLLDTTGAYFDSCGLVVELHRGTTFVDVGESGYGPVVTPELIVPKQPKQPMTSRQGLPVSRLRIERDRLLVGDDAVFLRILPDHNESAELLRQLGVNSVWVSDLHAAERMRSIKDGNLLVLATPPHPEFDPADFSMPLQGLPPLDDTHPLPDMWMFGTRIGADQFPHLLAWAREIRSADKLRRRPLMADVVSAEGVASRQIDLVGISQHSTGWLRNFGEARNRSFLKQNATAQLTLAWEWIQTQAPAKFAQWRDRSGSQPVFVEPEQIMMQLVASLSAGSRGVGFWKTGSLESSDPASQETATAIELANLYLDILGPLLIEGRISGHINVSTVGSTDGDRRQFGAAFNTGINADGYRSIPSGPDAAVISTPGSSLVLAAFWDQQSHFVPQTLFAQQARLTVSATETASAWQIFATGLRGLRREQAAGGLQLDIEDFDQLAAILVSSNTEKRQQLEARIQSRAQRAGQLFVELAQLKLSRVQQTCATIDELIGAPDATTARSFQNAGRLVAAAEASFQRADYPSAERLARSSMREMRTVQNRYWGRATQLLTTPMASPHTVSFSTLPDHWRLMNRMQASRPSGNLVPSGDFNSLRLLSDGAWKKISPQDEHYYASADIVTETAGSNQVLQLSAFKRHADRSDAESGKPSLLVRSPEIAAVAGDIFEVTLKAKLGQRFPAEEDRPLLLFDDDLGPEFAVRPELQPSWRTFRMFRQASINGPFRVWIALNGVAEVIVDEISVVRRASGPAQSDPESSKTQGFPALPVSSGSRRQGAGHSNSSLP